MDQHRKIVIIPKDLLSAIEDYRFSERKQSFADALRDLARSGLQLHQANMKEKQGRAHAKTQA